MKRYPILILSIFLMTPLFRLYAGIWNNPDGERDGWIHIAWYGWMHEAGNDWIYHPTHGWSQGIGDTAESVWFFDKDMGWLWSGEGVYPHYYAPGAGEWLRYSQGSREPRYLQEVDSAEWMEVHPRVHGTVELAAGTYDWRHREFTESEEHELLNRGRNVVTTQFETEVIENDLVRVTLLPGWGARILSIYYKPLDFELLSYAKGDKFSDIIYAPGAFYYDDWLLLPGGINPTFPEGEHGKYWGVPWDVSVIEDNGEQVTVRMSMTDHIDWPGRPGKFNNGLTGLTADMDVTVWRNRSCIEIAYTLTNNRNETIPYEFWTAASLAPLPPELTATSSNLEIVMDQEKLLLRDFWNWMKTVETDDDSPGDDIYWFDQLAWLDNWQGSGIAYAYPLTDNPWWGVINHDYDWGVLRTAEEPDGAPGMKIWGTGSDYGMFELWSGHSQEFFEDAFIGPLEVKTWKEFFLPTAGLSAVSHANSHGAVQGKVNIGSLTGSVDLAVFSTWQSANLKLQVHAVPVSGDPVLLGEALLSFSATAPTQFLTLPFPMLFLPVVDFRIQATLTDFFSGEERLWAELDF